MDKLSHYDEAGQAHMVDVSGKTATRREATAATTAGTGVEMEAMVAASVAALTVYDMTKALDKGIRIREVVLLRKSGGKSGEYRREG